MRPAWNYSTKNSTIPLSLELQVVYGLPATGFGRYTPLTVLENLRGTHTCVNKDYEGDREHNGGGRLETTSSRITHETTTMYVTEELVNGGKNIFEGEEGDDPKTARKGEVKRTRC